MANCSCKYKKDCSAPLCPLYKESLEGIWYPDEEICKRRFAPGQYDWIKVQKKIVKVKANPNYYFTLEMLTRNCIIRKGIKGLDPNRPEAYQLQKWIEQHPPKKEMSEEDKEKVRERFKKFVKKKNTKKGNKKTSKK